MEEYMIVNGSEKHLDKLEELETLCFSMPWTREQLSAQFPDDNHIFLVMEQDGIAVGYVGMMFVLDEGYISNVAVSPLHRKKGLADALIRRLIEISTEKELAFITLEVRQSNHPAISLYEKHGFVKVGLRKNYYDLPKDDAILMTKFLK